MSNLKIAAIITITLLCTFFGGYGIGKDHADRWYARHRSKSAFAAQPLSVVSIEGCDHPRTIILKDVEITFPDSAVPLP